MRIAITGATGFIGRYIVARLVEQGHRLRTTEYGFKTIYLYPPYQGFFN